MDIKEIVYVVFLNIHDVTTFCRLSQVNKTYNNISSTIDICKQFNICTLDVDKLKFYHDITVDVDVDKVILDNPNKVVGMVLYDTTLRYYAVNLCVIISVDVENNSINVVYPRIRVVCEYIALGADKTTITTNFEMCECKINSFCSCGANSKFKEEFKSVQHDYKYKINNIKLHDKLEIADIHELYELDTPLHKIDVKYSSLITS